MPADSMPNVVRPDAPQVELPNETALLARFDGLLRTLARQFENSDDVYQDLYLAVLTLRQRYRADHGVEFDVFVKHNLEWLVRNRRRQIRRRSRLRLLPLDDRLLEAIEEGELHLASGSSGHARTVLAEALAGLKPRAREILLRHCLNGEEISTIAKRLGLSERAVRRTLQRVEARLRNELGPPP